MNKILTALPRQTLSAIIQLKTGHGYFNSYLVRIPNSGVISNACSCSSTSQTPEHLLLSCSNYKVQRKELKRALKKELGNLPLTIPILLYTTKGLKALAIFLSSTQIATRARQNQDQAHRNIGWGRLEK